MWKEAKNCSYHHRYGSAKILWQNFQLSPPAVFYLSDKSICYYSLWQPAWLFVSPTDMEASVDVTSMKKKPTCDFLWQGHRWNLIQAQTWIFIHQTSNNGDGTSNRSFSVLLIAHLYTCLFGLGCRNPSCAVVGIEALLSLCQLCEWDNLGTKERLAQEDHWLKTQHWSQRLRHHSAANVSGELVSTLHRMKVRAFRSQTSKAHCNNDWLLSSHRHLCCLPKATFFYLHLFFCDADLISKIFPDRAVLLFSTVVVVGTNRWGFISRLTWRLLFISKGTMHITKYNSAGHKG